MKFFSYFEQLGLHKQVYQQSSVDSIICILREMLAHFPFYIQVESGVIYNRFLYV